MMSMISCVIPFYKRFELFNATFRLNSFLLNENVESILVLDDPSEEAELTRFCISHPKLKAKVLVNDCEHSWRPPCKAINVGLRHAAGEHIAIFSPENVIALPQEDFLTTVSKTYPNRLICGTSYGFVGDISNLDQEGIELFLRDSVASNKRAGFILFPKSAAVEICGWDESRIEYGACDGDFHNRLERIGITRKWCPFIHVVVVYHQAPRRGAPFEPLRDSIVLVDQLESWGTDFNRIAYDWKACT